MSKYIEFSEENPHFPWWASSASMKRWKDLIRPMLGPGLITREISPDVPELNLAQHHLVFVYGTLKKNKSAHGHLKGASYLCPGYTKAESFLLWQTKTGSPFPVMMIKEADEKGAKAVQGEVYIVDVPTMKRLDHFEHNGDLYRRIRLRVNCGAEHKGKSLSAWAYVGMHKVWKPEISDGKLRLCPNFKMKKEPFLSYYTFVQQPISQKKEITCP